MNTNRNRFFALMWLPTLIVLRQLLPDSAFADGFTAVYTVLAYGSYAAIYLAPTFIITWLLERFARAGKTAATVAIIGSGLTIVLLFVDARIDSLYGFHINGFVVNLVLTFGGLDSLGSEARTNVGIALVIVVLMLMPLGLWFVSRLRVWPTPRLSRIATFIIAGFALVHLSERVMYSLADIQSRGEALGVAVQPPLVLWIPGRAPAVDDRLSAHMDLPATLLPLLGVQNPASDHSLGFNLLEPPARPYAILSDWDRVVDVDENIKITVPMSAKGFFRQQVTDFNDQPIANPSAILESRNRQLVQVMQDISRFFGKTRGRGGQEMTLEKGAACCPPAGNQPQQLAPFAHKP